MRPGAATTVAAGGAGFYDSDQEELFMDASSAPADICRLLIVGMARSGVAAALLARQKLPAAEVVICDSDREPEAAERLTAAGVVVEAGRQDEALLDGCDLLVKSPGVPGNKGLPAAARTRGIPVWGEVELASRFLANPIIGVTGTNGKTTTTELIGHILKTAGVACRTAGNVGTPLSSLVGEVADDELLVVELSSFQLEDTVTFRPDVAVLLNLTEDHLDRHDDMEQYIAAKLNIFARQGPADLAVLNGGDAVIRSLTVPGAAPRLWFATARPSAGDEAAVFADNKALWVDPAGLELAAAGVRGRLSGSVDSPAGRNANKTGEDSVKVIDRGALALRGEHNLENALAAASVCLGLGLTPSVVAAGLTGFPGVRHRLERVAVIDGVEYINDSKATNVDAAIKALTAFDRGIHLILGGSLKGCSFDRLAVAAAAPRVSEVVLIGEAAAEIESSLKLQGRAAVRAGGLAEAVRLASSHSRPGDVVLLAPACASYDQYRNFEERGEHFVSLVTAMAAGEN